jgi:hypothetical protein
MNYGAVEHADKIEAIIDKSVSPEARSMWRAKIQELRKKAR